MIVKMGGGQAFHGRVQIRTEKAENLTQAEIQEFLKGSRTIEFGGQNRTEVYGWVQRVLSRLSTASSFVVHPEVEDIRLCEIEPLIPSASARRIVKKTRHF